ncbi:MAG: MBOAT family O-acyltransferase [Sinimarinibacterium flocculans]|uniref:MBOAT family O-acyltransferase n=1 Tax=Sinimarinibacterium flocculans TaxID=985250 RepID=UPI003C558AA1
MVFSSNVFLFLFLPLFLALYYACPRRGRNVVILVGSYVFYAWWRVDFLLLFVAVTAWNFGMGRAIAARLGDRDRARRWLATGVAGDLAVLGYFKYAGFGVDSLNALLQLSGSAPITPLEIILPIGISFYVFQAISYLVDVYRRDVEASRDPVGFAAFIALFPQLIAGPVLRYKDVADQFYRRQHSVELFALGATRFMQGFIKKVFIADTIAPIADAAFALENPSTADAWIGALAYTAQLYFDFSGYSDMAIGLGLMIGFRFVENFNQPYVSQSITEFWRRWHISLSNWLRDYLYVPLGGNRHGTLRTYRNLMLTMLLGGLWHGANWTFVVWGAWHGAWLAIERMLGVKANARGFSVGRWGFTFLLVIFGWVLFRAPDLSVATTFMSAMLGVGGNAPSADLAAQLTGLQLGMLVVAYLVIVIAGTRVRQRETGARPQGPTLVLERPLLHALVLPLFALAVLRLAAQSYSPFLYFQF